MNLIDFHVTKIIKEEYGKVYELFNMTREDVDKETGESWINFLLSDGVEQEYEYWDDGGVSSNKDVFKLGCQHYVGYVGQH